MTEVVRNLKADQLLLKDDTCAFKPLGARSWRLDVPVNEVEKERATELAAQSSLLMIVFNTPVSADWGGEGL